MAGGVKMKKSFNPSFLVAEGMVNYQNMREIQNLWFWWVVCQNEKKIQNQNKNKIKQKHKKHEINWFYL